LWKIGEELSNRYLFFVPEGGQKGGYMAILIKCGKLIDGNGGPPIHDALIVVEGEKITAVGRAEEVKAPTGANVIDLSQLTVLPGIIDCHTHLMAHFGEVSAA
jgi:imidazolonepropionase-like amidohydrolase